MASSSALRPFVFVELAAEIRVIIYKYLYVICANSIPWQLYVAQDSFFESQEKPPKWKTYLSRRFTKGFLHTCRQVYIEAVEVLYKYNEFVCIHELGTGPSSLAEFQAFGRPRAVLMSRFALLLQEPDTYLKDDHWKAVGALLRDLPDFVTSDWASPRRSLGWKRYIRGHDVRSGYLVVKHLLPFIHACIEIQCIEDPKSAGRKRFAHGVLTPGQLSSCIAENHNLRGQGLLEDAEWIFPQRLCFAGQGGSDMTGGVQSWLRR